MTASECYRRLQDAGYGVKLGPRGGIIYTGGNPPAELRGYEGEWATWLREPPSLRKKLGDQYPRCRKRVEAEYDRLFVSYVNSDAHCRMGAELAMQVAFRMAGGKS